MQNNSSYLCLLLAASGHNVYCNCLSYFFHCSNAFVVDNFSDSAPVKSGAVWSARQTLKI